MLWKGSYPCTTTNFTADLETYCFPLHIAATDLRPDMVWWDDSQKQLWLAELTVCFETSFEEARERKEVKVRWTCVNNRERAGYNTTLITLEIGSWGIAHLPGFTTLAHVAISQRDLSSLLHERYQAVITGSHKIWCTRNRLSYTFVNILASFSWEQGYEYPVQDLTKLGPIPSIVASWSVVHAELRH